MIAASLFIFGVTMKSSSRNIHGFPLEKLHFWGRECNVNHPAQYSYNIIFDVVDTIDMPLKINMIKYFIAIIIGYF